ncbi:hypothetical protein AVEN_98534-1 [Araneus ventricosus]|uniref:Uncharacterized protein n=1 Tax=Araneus ventricosus TaxID=182803 RepID=A0A4Y2K7Y4_ARAVE|nr:hypothetical protein AVEN_98534-1 [Araneus ventricosus]
MTMLLLQLQKYYQQQTPLSSPDKSSSNSEGEEEFVLYFAKIKHETDSQEQNVALQKKLFTQRVTSALDRNKVSDLKAVRIMVPIEASLGEDTSSLSISRSTVHKVRKKARSEFVDVVAKNYSPK